MLSEQEKEWLERRKNLCGRCFIESYCSIELHHGVHTEECWNWRPCVNSDGGMQKHAFYVDFRDAAEFEARVAEKLAKSICVVCPDNKNGSCQTRQNYPQRADIEACRMRHARIAAEAEMDAPKI